MLMKKVTTNSGLTLLEVVLAISIVALVAVMAFLPLNEFRQRQSLAGASEQVLSLLGEARSKTLASWENSQYGVHFATDQVVLFKGNQYPGTTVTQFDLPSVVQISEINLEAGATAVMFERITGTTNQSGSIKVELLNSSKFEVLHIEPSGLVRRN